MISGNLKEKDDDIPWLGRNSDAPYIAFGDDTSFNEILLYAFIVVERASFKDIEDQLLTLKKMLCIPAAIPIHTKDFLNGYKRRKLGIENLNVGKMIDEIIDVINKSSCCVIYNFLAVPKGGKIYPDDFKINDKKIHSEHKAILHQIASSCFCPFLKLQGKHLTLKDFEVFISQDKTKVKTVGTKKRQAQYLSETRIPTTSPIQKGSYARLKPHYVLTNKYLFCQIADVIAYVLSHALSKKCKNSNFKKQLKKIKHLYIAPAG